MGPGSRFSPVLDDKTVKDPSRVDRVVLLTGKLYYELMKERQARDLIGKDKTALIRIEELSPFPFEALDSVLKRYEIAKKFIWVQEEARNQGAWTHVKPRIESTLEHLGLEGTKLGYIGRKPDAVPAVGVGKAYKEQQSRIISAAFEGR